MDAGAEDDAARSRQRAQLYAPPAGARRPRTPQAGVLTREQALRMAQQAAAEDAARQAGRVPR